MKSYEKPEKLMDIPQSAEMLNVSVSTFNRLLGDGAIPFVRVGLGRGRIRIDPNDLKLYITKNKQRRMSR